MILSGPAIDNYVKEGKIEISPYEPKHLNPASIDLTLGAEVAVYDRWVWIDTAVGDVGHFSRCLTPRDSLLDSKEEPTVHRMKIPDGGFELEPGILYLMHTRERVYTEQFVPVLDGKSSIGRLGIVIHLTAGYGDPGFDGQYTLEVTAVHRVKIYAGMRFCQMRFHELVDVTGRHMSYKSRGHYTNEYASGPVPSMAWRQYKE